jgi:hypothetical protein
VQILEFLHIGEVVHDENIGDAVSVQLMNQIAADEACATGDDQHYDDSPFCAGSL